MALPFEWYLTHEFGPAFTDARALLPDVAARVDGQRFGPRPLGGLDTIAIHHTDGPKDQTWPAVRAFHVGTRGWSGIAYHVGIRRGAVSYIGDVNLQRACVGNLNHRVICLVVTGGYTREALDAVDAIAVRRTVAAIQRWAVEPLGHTLRVKGHGELLGQATACPGPPLLALAREMNGSAGATPTIPPGPNMAKVTYFLEQAQRAAEAEGLRAESAYIGSHYTADAKAKAGA